MPSPDPIVSVVVANFNGERFLADALASALDQTLRDIEVILVDDASTDGSLEIARVLACEDSRLRVLARETRSGPGGARNDGFAAARGRWIAILDSDDMMHPARLEQLVGAAEAVHADLIADDLLIFRDDAPPASLLSARQRRLGWVSAADFIAHNRLLSREPALGYLKPLIRTAFLRHHGISYDPALRIGEDYDLIAQLLAKGARFRLLDTLGYFYRKHVRSISHRLSDETISEMRAADTRLRALFDKDAVADEIARAFDVRLSSIERAATLSAIVAALKAHRWGEAGMLALRNPRAIPLLADPIASRWKKLWPPREDGTPDGAEKRVCLISRQRVIGNSNGSSAYLLALAEALRDDGHRITLISPSVATFGRWPFLRLRPEMDVFDEIHIRGAWRIGKRLRIARDPRIAIAAASAVAARLAARFGFRLPAWDRPAPYAVAQPWHREDQLYIARHAPRTTRLVLADYAFTTPAIPYALAPSARSAVVMHDFFSARAERFREQRVADSVVALDEAEEVGLLRQADAVIAIQKHEAAEIRRLLPERQVILAPLASRVAATPQAGDRRTLLFVGSNTAPNIIGLRWFFTSVWPEITSRIPDARLLVAGGVAAGFPRDVPGVRFLGLVADLDPLYAEAGAAISPLTVGSGLKIKLIEALGQGKAIVATSATTEGCDEAVAEAIYERDDARAFADAVVELLRDDGLRHAKAAQALDVARRLYSPEACYRDLLAFAASDAGVTRSLPTLDEAPARIGARCAGSL